MKFPWHKANDADGAGTESGTAANLTDEPVSTVKGSSTTAGKGRPTPSRRQAEGRRRGPVAPAPQTRAEARARRKELKNSLSKEDRKAAAAERRAAANDRRERMMQGDERYLTVRDRGPERAMARDLVDSKRHVSTMFLPVAIAVMVYMFITLQSPTLGALAMPILLVMVVIMAIEGTITGRRVNNRVREKFPDTTATGFRLGWYAFTRTTQFRRMRVPRPRVEPGTAV